MNAEPLRPAVRMGTYAGRWSHWYRRAFPAYAIFLFSSTHFPKLTGLPEVPGNDKTIHVVGFALLTFLFWRFCETFDPFLSARFIYGAALFLIVWAGFDEATQRYVGRSSDWLDFAADSVGIVLMCLILEWRRRARIAPRALT